VVVYFLCFGVGDVGFVLVVGVDYFDVLGDCFVVVFGFEVVYGYFYGFDGVWFG